MPKILVIDHEETVRSVVKQHLVKANHEVIEAESGETAIRKIKNGDSSLTVDAAIFDIRIPPIKETEAIHYFQKEYPTLPLIVMTSFTEAVLAEGLLKNAGGIKAYLLKPVGKEALLAAVNQSVLLRKNLNAQNFSN